jgi:colicin import membrane protein
MWTRRSLELGLALLLTAGPASAQEPDARTERERIGRERADIEARAVAGRATCRTRFAVAACVEGIEDERRARLRMLDRQRALLDEAERKQRAVAREARIAERRRQDAAERPDRAASAPK